jgi:hypothetical protein
MEGAQTVMQEPPKVTSLVDTLREAETAMEAVGVKQKEGLGEIASKVEDLKEKVRTPAQKRALDEILEAIDQETKTLPIEFGEIRTKLAKLITIDKDIQTIKQQNSYNKKLIIAAAACIVLFELLFTLVLK